MKFKFEISAQKINEIVGGVHTGDFNLILTGLNNIEFAQKGDITFYSDKKFKSYLNTTTASLVIVDENFIYEENYTFDIIKTKSPYSSFAGLLIYLNENFGNKYSGISNQAKIEENVSIGKDVFIGPGAYIGDNSIIGNNVIIHPNVTIYNNVEIGDNTIIHSNTVICSQTEIGKNCLILPGAVIGSDGFGFLENKDGTYTRIPQLGNVIIRDNVEVGANTTIDRAMVGSTIINDGVKLDNLIQIGHNCRVGENTAMVALSGISGSTHIGKRNRIAGQVGIAGHIFTGDDVVILAKSGVNQPIENKGIYFGAPPRERMAAFRIETEIGNLPETAKMVRALQKDVQELKSNTRDNS